MSLDAGKLQTLVVLTINSTYALGSCNTRVVPPHLDSCTVFINVEAW